MSVSKLRVYHRLLFAAHQIQKSADRALVLAAGVTTPQAAVLSVVAAAGYVTQREVAQQLGLNESAVTAMTNRLLRLGLLERARSEDDARAWQLCLTEEARTVLKQVKAPFARVNQTLESILNPDEILKLTDYLDRIGSAFNQE